MNEGPIEVVTPTSRAMGRMTTILFRPFDFGKWFVLGFTAWLAGLMEGGGSSSGGGGGDEFSGVPGEEGGDEWREIWESVTGYVRENLDWILPLGIGLAVLLIALFVVLLWVGSRGKFMFLDNVVHNRALVTAPWREFRTIGNSLFRWRLVFSLVVTVVLLSVIGLSAYFLVSHFDEANLPPGWVAGLVAAVVGFLGLVLVIGYIGVLLEDFVIPTMYRQSVPATEGWRRVLALHGTRPGRFILYALWRLVLLIGSVFVIIATILLTCCVAALVLAIPVVNAVLLLPITVFFRALGPEFLRQFGREWDLWAGAEDPFGFGAGPVPPAGRF